MSRANPLTTHINAGIAANAYVKARAEIHSFEDAKTYLDNEYEKPLASNMTIRLTDAGRRAIIRLYQTDTLTYFDDGTFEASNGGFNTPTTTSRLNRFSPNKRWFFYHKNKRLWGFSSSQGLDVEMERGKRFNA